MAFFAENKSIDTTTKEAIASDLAEEINTAAPKGSTVPTAAPKHMPEISKRETLLRIKRQLALENELSSAADESENLGIEQVSFDFRFFPVLKYTIELPCKCHKLFKSS